MLLHLTDINNIFVVPIWNTCAVFPSNELTASWPHYHHKSSSTVLSI